MPSRHLRPAEEENPIPKGLVDPATGQVFDLEGYVQSLKDLLAGAEKDINAWRMRYGDLKRDKDAEVKEAPDWPVALRIFVYWRTTCNHGRSEFDVARYELIHRILEAHKDGQDKLEPYARAEALCKRAIDGAAYDPFVTRRKNGSAKRHDGIDLIFRSADKFEEFVNRAPLEQPPAAEPPAPRPRPSSGGTQEALPTA